MANVLVIGFKIFGFDLEDLEIEGGKIIEESDNSFRYAVFSQLPPFEDYDIIIFPFLVSTYVTEEIEKLAYRRACLALERGANVCVLCGAELRYMLEEEGADEIDEDAFRYYIGGMFLRGVVRKMKVKPQGTDTVPVVDELTPFIREYGSTGFTFELYKPDAVHIICETKYYDLSDIAGFAAQKGDGLLYVLPVSPPPGNEHPFMCTLTHGILAHSQRVKHPSAAPIVKSFQFAKEKPLLAERDELKKKVADTEEHIKAYDEKKDILFLRDDPLADRLAEWLTKYMVIATRRHEQYIEDFWLLDENGNDVAICEAKGVNTNVKREHITALVLHREERDLPDDFPSILIMNTFANATTIKQKDRQGVGRIERRRATRNNVLIVRTLDLVRLLDLLEQGRLEQTEVRALLLNETGWLKASDKELEIVKE